MSQAELTRFTHIDHQRFLTVVKLLPQLARGDGGDGLPGNIVQIGDPVAQSPLWQFLAL